MNSKKKRIVDIEEVYATQGPTGFGGVANHINNQLEIIKSDEIVNGMLSNEETVKKLTHFHKKIPDKFVTRNINALKKLILSRTRSMDDKDKENLTKGNKSLKGYIKSNLVVNNIRNSDVIELYFTSHNPELAKFALTELIDSYLKYDVDAKIQVTTYANKQINLRLSELLTSMEKKLKKVY